jgi:hypothetical protein
MKSLKKKNSWIPKNFNLAEKTLFSLLSQAQPKKVEEEGKLPGFPPPTPFSCFLLPYLLSFSLHKRTHFSVEFSLNLFIVYDD